MTATRARYLARQALRSARTLRARERELESDGFYEEALECHRLVVDQTCSFRYWRQREQRGA